MKHVTKGEPPLFFSDFIAKKHPQTWDDIAPIRQQLREYILEQEQQGVCAYTEIRLQSDENCHIDHFRTRNLFPQKTMEYANMLVSCNSECYGAKYKDKQIRGVADYDKLINPVEEDPSVYMEYTLTGEMQALDSERERGELTIRYFNLNERRLVNRRKKAILNLLAMRNYLTEDELVESIGEFETMVRQLYKQTEKL